MDIIKETVRQLESSGWTCFNFRSLLDKATRKEKTEAVLKDKAAFNIYLDQNLLEI